MSNWWESLTGDLQVFYVIGAVATVFLFLQVVLLLFGVGFDVDFSDGDDATGFISLRSLTGFFFAFGWVGVIVKEADASTPIAVLVAFLSGVALFFGVALLWRNSRKLHESGALDYQNAVGVTGSVYLAIPAGRSGIGKVEVMVQGRLVSIDAQTEAPIDIVATSRIKVTQVIDVATVLVEPLAVSNKPR